MHTRTAAAHGRSGRGGSTTREERGALVRINWPLVRGEEWAYWEPPALVPVPATEVRPLTGHRLVLHDPILRSWSHEVVAASEPHQHHGEPHAGILSATDWYRRQADPTYVAVPRPVPLDRLWVETQVEVPTDDEPELAEVDQSYVPRNAGPATRIVDASRPPVRRLRRGLFEPTVHGRLAAVTAAERPLWPMRVCSEPYLDELPDLSALNLRSGDLTTSPVGPVVTLCTEADWHLWAWTGHTPTQMTPRSLFRVWVE